MRRTVVVSGLPASGKSTLGRRIAAAIDAQHIDKDDILEALFDALGAGDGARRTELSRAADTVLQRLTRATPGAVLTSWWRHPRSARASGTPTEWLEQLPRGVIEVHCVCAPAVAAARFCARARHPGHLDRDRSPQHVEAEFAEHAALGALRVGEVVEVNTDRFVDDAVIASLVRTIIGA